jgi:hypothetical protein
MTERVRLSAFDQMQNRVNVVGGVRGNENEHDCHRERKRDHSVNLSYVQHAESFNTHFSD